MTELNKEIDRSEERSELAKPVPQEVVYGESLLNPMQSKFDILEQAGATGARANTARPAETAKPVKDRKHGIKARMSADSRAFVKIAAAKKGMTIENYVKRALNMAFEMDSICDNTGTLVRFDC